MRLRPPPALRRALPYLVAVVFFIGWSRESVQQHGRPIWERWQTELRADALGYYVYLPVLLTHGMHPSTLRPETRELLSESYVYVDEQHERFITQYTYVIALLEMPFFCIAESIEGWGRTDGFTTTHHRLIDIAGVFYWTCGLLLIYFALQRWRPASWLPALLVIVTGTFGTSLFYYAFRMPGYAHVYCFFLICLAMWVMLSGLDGPGRRWKRVVFVLACALLVVARPLDLIAVAVLYAWHWSEVNETRHWRELLVLQVTIGLLVALPQMVYWYDTHGRWIYYSYEKEGFSNWRNPELSNVLFAPMNGLLPWAPAFLILPFGLWTLWREQRTLAIVLGVGFGLLAYACASWWTWSFGCSFGQRSFAQYAAFLMVVLWIAFNHATKAPAWMRLLGIAALLFVSRTWYFMALEFKGCYFGGEREWRVWAEMLSAAIK